MKIDVGGQQETNNPIHQALTTDTNGYRTYDSQDIGKQASGFLSQLRVNSDLHNLANIKAKQEEQEAYLIQGQCQGQSQGQGQVQSQGQGQGQNQGQGQGSKQSMTQNVRTLYCNIKCLLQGFEKESYERYDT